jgi:glycerol-3-phosphate dehydrogenase
MLPFLVSFRCPAANGHTGVRRVRIGIIGAGALGSVIGGTLAEAGNDVLLVNHNRAYVDTINRCRRRHIYRRRLAMWTIASAAATLIKFVRRISSPLRA